MVISIGGNIIVCENKVGGGSTSPKKYYGQFCVIPSIFVDLMCKTHMRYSIPQHNILNNNKHYYP